MCLSYTVHQHSLSGLKVSKLTFAGVDGPGRSGGGGGGGGGGMGNGASGAGRGAGGKVFRGMRSRVECAVWKRW